VEISGWQKTKALKTRSHAEVREILPAVKIRYTRLGKGVRAMEQRGKSLPPNRHHANPRGGKRRNKERVRAPAQGGQKGGGECQKTTPIRAGWVSAQDVEGPRSKLD